MPTLSAGPVRTLPVWINRMKMPGPGTPRKAESRLWAFRWNGIVSICPRKLMADETNKTNKTSQEPLANQPSWYLAIVIMFVARWAKTQDSCLLHSPWSFGGREKGGGNHSSWPGHWGSGRDISVFRASLWEAQPLASTSEAAMVQEGNWSFSFTSSKMEAHGGFHWADQGPVFLFLIALWVQSWQFVLSLFLTLQRKHTHAVHLSRLFTAPQIKLLFKQSVNLGSTLLLPFLAPSPLAWFPTDSHPESNVPWMGEHPPF